MNLKSVFTHLVTHDVTETLQAFRVKDYVYDKSVDDYLKKVNDNLNKYGIGEIHIKTSTGEILDITESFKENYTNDEIEVVIKKKSIIPYFLTARGFEDYLNSENALHSINCINLFFIERPYSSIGVNFSNNENASSGIHLSTSSYDQVESIKYVKPLSDRAQNYLPSDLSKWVTESTMLDESPIEWKLVSTRKCITLLSTEYDINNGGVDLYFLSDKRKWLRLSSSNTATYKPIIKLVHEICFWIYFENRDIVAKHTLFNSQLCQLIVSDDGSHEEGTLAPMLENALTNSKLAYKYHFYNTNKELTKILSSLNEKIFNHVDNIRKNTVLLISSTWRDFAVFLAVILLRYSLKKEGIDQDYHMIIGRSFSIYLAISFILNSSVAFWHYGKLKSSMKKDKEKIYSYLSNTEYEEYALNPIKDAHSMYKRVFFVLLVIYAIVICFILFTL